MKWELGALKILARNPTVPGVALADAVTEIERLQAQNAKLIEAGNHTAQCLKTLVGYDKALGLDRTEEKKALQTWGKASAT